SGGRRNAAPPPVPAAEPSAEVGYASVYARHFEGRRTASGERYDYRLLTAAHRTLPFGTRVRVTNLGTGRSVVVTVNDRGPFPPDRVIDLSRRAARQIVIGAECLQRVCLDVVACTQYSG